MKRFVWKWVRRLAIGLGASLVALVLFLTLTTQGRTGFQTALFVTQVLDVPWKPQSWFAADPVRQEITYPPARVGRMAGLWWVCRQNGCYKFSYITTDLE